MSKTQKIVILGGPGDGLVILEAIRQCAAAGQPVEAVGFLNDGLPKGSTFKNLPVFGPLTDWPELPDDVVFYAALRKLKEMPQRCALIEGLGIPAERWTTIIHPTAILSGDVKPGYGSYIAAYAVIQPEVDLGNFISIRAGSNIGHNCRMENFAGLGAEVCMCGGSSVGRGAVVTSGSILGNNVHVGAFSIISMGTPVPRSVPEFSLVMGNPGRVIQSLKEDPHE